jgi:hypothetical protein
MNVTPHPTWDCTIQLLFSEPYWIYETKRANVAKEWQRCMSGFDVMLNNYESVQEWSETIFPLMFKIFKM